ncbi:MAG: amidohydrolase family protein [Gammaproteobacteria bacterium]|nr:amidohydrolase family protein [Gammaproteobacteria bacterium]
MASFDTLIKAGTVVDGTGAAPYTADIAFKDGRIAAIGRDLGAAHETVDADGLVVAPGWVDIHTHYDGQAIWDPVLPASLRHGVTTLMMGNCGVGFAPAAPERHDWLIELMEGVEDIPGVALRAGLPWNWESFPQYMDVLDATPRSFDIATQLSHGALRAYVMGQRGADNENATADDIGRMAMLTREAMDAGAFGFSSSRTAVHVALDGRPVPGTYAADDELVAIAKAVRGSGRGLVEIVLAGVAGEDVAGLDREMAMLRRVAEQSGAPVMFLMVQQLGDSQQWRRQLAVCEDAAKAGLKIIPQVAGRPVSILFCFEGEHPWKFMPSYQEIANLPFDERYARLRDPAFKARLLSEQDPNEQGFSLLYKNPSIWDFTYPAGSPINYTPDPANSIAKIARRENRSPWEVAYDLLLADNGQAFLMYALTGYADGNTEAVQTMVRHPLTVLGLSDAGAHVRFIADYGVHSYMLSHYARDAHKDDPRHMPLEFVVKRLTLDNAQVYGMPDRGRLAPGLRADVNLIDLANLKTGQPRMVYDLPAQQARLDQTVSGYVGTWVKGIQVQRNGQDTGARPGRLVRSR